MALPNVTDSLRRSWENLNERERRLVALMGAVFVSLVAFIVVYGTSTAISSVEEENEKIVGVIGEIRHARRRIRDDEAKWRAAQHRYDTKAPALGSFLEGQADLSSLALREVTDQPEKVSGHFRRRGVRARLAGVGLRPVIELMSNIDSSVYPVAIDRVTIEHFQPGDSYNVELGVQAFDREGAAAHGPTRAARPTPSGVAGPPAP